MYTKSKKKGEIAAKERHKNAQCFISLHHNEAIFSVLFAV